MILHALAQIAIREGMTPEALDDLDQADGLLPGDPAIAHARGQALADVWQWKDAVPPLRAASIQAPLDDGLLSHLAVALASAGDPAAALAAAGRGLALSPRDPDLLRVQASALEELGAPPIDVLGAREAFAQWRAPDDAPALKSQCARRFASCALERIPVHVHLLH
jgi:predicted Zn-dependent protease